MIEVSDYYKKITPTLSNSKELDLSLDQSVVFPEDGVYIGDFISATGHKAPALIPLQDTNGVCFLVTPENREDIYNTLQLMALRLAASIKTKLCKFILYDASGLGANLITLVRLANEIKGSQILSEPEALREKLKEARRSIPTTIQNVLGYQYVGKTLMDYNEEAKEMSKPYQFVFITDFPNSLSEEHQELITDIVRTGKQAGIFVILGLDTTYEQSGYKNCDPFKMAKFMTTIYPVGDRYYIKNIPHESFYNTFRLELNREFPSPDVLEALIGQTNEKVRKDDGIKVELSDILTQSNFWSRHSSGGLEIPIGKASIRDIQMLRLSTEDGILDSPHHGVIGGATGSGKTVLLHDIICTGAWLYPPDELQYVLLDFKEGTEFKMYEQLPHVKILSTRSDLDFAKSVFEYLDKEISRRGELFKEKKVSNIGRYNEVSKDKLPRILLIIDEFQKLLDGEFKLANWFAATLEDFGRRARSFGINMLLSTQSLAGVDFHHAMSQFGLRIVMKMNTSRDCAFFLDSNNIAPYTDLTRKGDAIFNDRGGLLEGNIKFQAAYLGETRLLNLVSRFSDAATKRYGKPTPDEQYLYDGAQAGDYSRCEPEVSCMRPSEKEFTLYIGEPCSLSQKQVHFKLPRKNAANLIAVGKDFQARDSLIMHSVEQVYRQSEPDVKVLVLDGTDSEEDSAFETFCANNRVNLVRGEDAIKQKIIGLAEELKARKESSAKSSRNIVIIRDLSGIRELRPADRYSPAPALTVKLHELISLGPVNGIHFMAAAPTFKNYEELFAKVADSFDVKLELKGGDAYRIFKDMDERNAVKRPYQANMLLPNLEEPVRIKIYA